MQRQHSLPLLLGILAAALWLVWLLVESGAGELPAPGPTRDAPSVEGPSAPVEAASADAAEPAGEASPEIERRAAVDPSATWVIEGKALRGSKGAYPNVGVHLLLFEGYEAEGEPLRELRLTSGADGSFRWPIPPPTTTVTLQAKGDQDGHRSLTATHLVPKGGPPPTVKVHLYPMDCEVTGVVRGSSGQALEGAEVQAGREVAHTDGAGRYRLTVSSARSQAYLYAVAPGHAQCRAIAEVGGPGSVTEANIDLVASFRVKGRVVDGSGQPVAGATVRTFFTSRRSVETDVDGHFVLDHLDPRRAYHSVYARAAGYAEAKVTVDTEVPETEVPDLVVTRGIRVEGEVRDDRGHLLPGVELYIGFSPSAYNRLDAVSRDDGQFVFPHVPAGEQTLFAEHSGYAPDRRTLQLSKAQPVVAGVLVQLTRGHSIGGVVRNEQGDPMPDVRISPRHKGEYFGTHTVTGPDGRFHVEGLPGEKVDLEFWGRGIVRQNVPVTSFDHEDLEVVVQASGRVAGRVVDGVTGEPLDSFVIRFVRVKAAEGAPEMGGYGATWAREGHRFTETDGYWDSGDENLPPGAALGVEARAEGYAPGRLASVVAAMDPDPDANVLEMFAGASVTGRIVDAEGAPVSDAKIRIQASDDTSRHITGSPYEAGITSSGQDGTFGIRGVAPGESILLVEAPGVPLIVDGPFSVPRVGSVQRHIALATGAELTGRLLDQAGNPVAGATIGIYSFEGGVGFSHRGTTDASGGFAFTALPDGRYQLSQVESDVVVLSVFVRVEGGQVDPVVMQPDGECTLVGTIAMKDGSPVPSEVPVICMPRTEAGAERGAPPGRGTTARDGRFEIHGMRQGDYTVIVHHSAPTAMLYGEKAVQLTPGGQQVQIELAERSYR